MAERAVATTKASETKQTCPHSCNQKLGFNSSGSTADRILQLQRTAGNQAVQRLIKSRSLQAKLRISQPNDIYEQEADRVAEQVMRMPDSVIQLKCSKCNKDKKKILQAKKSSGQAALNQGQNVPSVVHEAISSPGQLLDPTTRTFMEPRFGHGFSQVRVHTGTQAAESARAVNALAYTVGRDMVFGAGQFAPDTGAGLQLIAHELTHVVQQNEAFHGTDDTLHMQREDSPTESSTLETVTAGLVGLLIPGGGPLDCLALLAILSRGLSGCTATSSLAIANTLHHCVSSTWLPYSFGMFGPQTTSLWIDYLDKSKGLPRPGRAFSGKGEVVTGFTEHHKSAEAEREIVDASIAALTGPAASLMPQAGTKNLAPVTNLIPAATLRARLENNSDPMGLIYDKPATTIPGNIAGGVSGGGPPGNTTPDPDTRNATGSLELSLDPSGKSLTIVPMLTFLVHDAVDFCPGGLGGALARIETVPMSVLEATEGRLGPIFAADVPFDVSYPGPGISKTVSASSPPRPPPSPPSPPSPPPSPSGPMRIHFNFDRPLPAGSSMNDSLDSNGMANLQALIDLLLRNPNLRVELVGRASPEGREKYNMDLSTRRVRMIAQGLHDAGIPTSQITSSSTVILPGGCAAVGTGLYSCGEVGATGPLDREVQAHIFTPSVTPPSPPNPVPPIPPGPTPTGVVTIKSMQFVTDHHVMQDNRSSWEPGKALFPKPDWEPSNDGGKSSPISHDRNTNVGVVLTYDASTLDLSGTPFTLTGMGTEGFLTFKGSGSLLPGDNQTILLTSDQATPDAIVAFENQAIDWSIQLPAGRQPLGKVLGLDVFITMAPPRRPEEVTYKRMAKAIELTGSIHTLEPHPLVHGIMLNFGAYNLDVVYDNAWKMADNLKLGAQCIDIVRFVMGLIETVGCPGVAEAKLIWARPTNPAQAVESDYLGGDSLHNYPRHHDHPTWRAALIDANACPNNFEAALKFTFGDTRYYPGGVPLIDRGGRKIIFTSSQQVVEIFQYLAWIEGIGDKKWNAREFLISYTGRRLDRVPFMLVCNSRVLP